MDGVDFFISKMKRFNHVFILHSFRWSEDCEYPIKMFTPKSANVNSWHQQTAEKRALKKGSKLSPPDVYPQEHRQEEDNLGHDRLKKGFQVDCRSLN